MLIAGVAANRKRYVSITPGSLTVTVPAGKVTSDLTNFPLCVNLGGIGDPNFWVNTTPGGRDIRLKDALGNYVPIDLVSFHKARATGALFAKVDLLAASDNVFTLEYGTASTPALTPDNPLGRHAVWADYLAVCMFESNAFLNRAEGPLPTITGTPTPVFDGGSPLSADLGVNFPGLERLTYSVSGGTQFSIGASFTQDVVRHQTFIAAHNSPSSTNVQLLVQSGTSISVWDVNNAHLNASPAINPRFDPYRVDATYDSTIERKIYVNGVLRNTDPTIVAQSSFNSFIVGAGRADTLQLPWIGKVGYAYLRSGVLSADWIKAVYDNLDNADFVTFSTGKRIDATQVYLEVMHQTPVQLDVTQQYLEVIYQP